MLSRIIGQGHHYYWIGTPGFWLFLGGLFSALEPVPLFLMAIGYLNMILALLLAGIIQVQLQRLSGMSFMEVQNILLPFYGWRTIGGLIALIDGLVTAYDLIMIGRKKTEWKGIKIIDNWNRTGSIDTISQAQGLRMEHREALDGCFYILFPCCQRVRRRVSFFLFKYMHFEIAAKYARQG